MRPPLEVADIFRQCGNDFRLTHTLSPEQRRVMRAIERCRTAALGGHVEQCDTCGHQRISYNSCRNRHCPKCQSLAKARWLEARLADLLPVEYFHVVFTLPEQLAIGCSHADREDSHPSLGRLARRLQRATVMIFAIGEKH